MKLSEIDPRIKLAMLVIISGIAVFSKSVVTLALMMALTLTVLIAGGVSPKSLFSQSRKFVRIIIALFIVQCVFTRSGVPVISVRGFAVITKNGLQNAGLVSLRLLLVLASALIVLTGETRDYLLALTQMKVPYEIAYMVMVALRFIPMLREEARDVLAAVQMRGLNIKKAPISKKISAYASVMIPIVAGALHRSEDTAMAMEARGFRSCPNRTDLRHLVIKRSDYIYFAVFAAITAAMLAVKGLIVCIFF